jgi:hypothetical protein
MSAPDFEIDDRLLHLSPAGQRVAWELASKRYSIDLESLARRLAQHLAADHQRRRSCPRSRRRR